MFLLKPKASVALGGRAIDSGMLVQARVVVSRMNPRQDFMGLLDCQWSLKQLLVIAMNPKALITAGGRQLPIDRNRTSNWPMGPAVGTNHTVAGYGFFLQLACVRAKNWILNDEYCVSNQSGQ